MAIPPPVKIGSLFTSGSGFVQRATLGDPKAVFEIPVCITGALSVSGSMFIEGGDLNITGSLNVTGSVSVTGSVDVTGSLSVVGAPVMTNPIVRTVTATGNMSAADGVLLLSASVAPIHLTLVSASIYDRPLYLKRVDGTLHNVVISASDGETIDGDPTKTLSAQWTAITLINNNLNWYIF